MKLKQQLSLLATCLFLGACSAENLLDTQVPPEEGADDLTRREVMLTLKNTLNLKPAATRAGDPIATADENYIETLDVYVFGSKDEAGPYTFQELHYYRDDASEVNMPGVEAYSFGLRAGADDATTNGLLKLKKGLFVKLYCVANRTTLYQTDAMGVVTKFDNFKSLLQDKPGQADNTVIPGTPTEAAFKLLHTKLIDPAGKTADDVLAPSLPMTGAYTTPLDLTDFGTSARTQISFKLTRMVARFDVVNDAAESKFTVTSISMANGQSGARFFPIETLITDPDELVTYPAREIEATTQQKYDETAGTTNLTKGAFYSWPSPKEDKGYLILSGKYTVNASETVNVSYQIPFQQMVNNIGTYIEVAHNHRYTIGITKAEQYHLDFNLKVDDWEDVEDLDHYEPDNDFNQGQALTLDAGNSNGAYVLDNGQISLLPAAGSKFGFEMGSNTSLADELVFVAGSAEWIKKTAVTPVTRASSMKMLYTFEIDDTKLTDPAKLLPVTIRLTNPASGMRKEIKVIATQGPEVSLASQEGNYSKYDAATKIVTMYNVVGQTVKLHVVAETRKGGTAEAPTETTGSTIAVTEDWLTASADVAAATGDYTLTLGAKQSASPLPSNTVAITSTASTVVTNIKVMLKDAAVTPLTENDIKAAEGTVNFTGGTDGAPKVSLAGKVGNSVNITVTSPEGVTATVEGDWLEVKVKSGVVTASIKADAADLNTPKTDGKIIIKNKLDATDTITIEVETTTPVV